MLYRTLGRNGLKVSALCLGTMQFGWTCNERMAFAVMDAYVEAGGTMLDTSDFYSRWIPGHQGGESEQIIGRWLAARGNRDGIVLATKVRHPMGDGPNDGGLSRRHILAAVDASLRRLQTEYIDLYQAHADDPDCPLDETLGAFDTLVRQGKVRYIGASNYAAERLAEALEVSEKRGYAAYCSLQPHYNLALRHEFEPELEPLCLRHGLGVIPYSPLASGFLTGKYRPGRDLPQGARASSVQGRYMNARGFAVLEAVDRVASENGASPAQIALAWLLAHPSVTAPIVGANTPEQLQHLLPAVHLQLDPKSLRALNDASEWRAS